MSNFTKNSPRTNYIILVLESSYVINFLYKLYPFNSIYRGFQENPLISSYAYKLHANDS